MTTRARKFYNVLVENLGEEVSASPDRTLLVELVVRGIHLTINERIASSKQRDGSAVFDQRIHSWV